MRNLLIASVMVSAALCSASQAATLTPYEEVICHHILHRYPSDSPMSLRVGNAERFVCNAGSKRETIVLTFGTEHDLDWWYVNAPDRRIMSEDDEAGEE